MFATHKVVACLASWITATELAVLLTCISCASTPCAVSNCQVDDSWYVERHLSQRSRACQISGNASETLKCATVVSAAKIQDRTARPATLLRQRQLAVGHQELLLLRGKQERDGHKHR